MRYVLLALLLAAAPALADSPYEKVERVFQGSETVAGERLAYPAGAAEVTTLIVTMDPGEETAWHEHGVPLFAYILEGELTVTYRGIGDRVYRTGDGFLEAMHVPHRGRNTGTGRCRILAVFMGGGDGKPTLPAPPE